LHTSCRSGIDREKGECDLEQIFLTAAVLLLPMLCTTAGAAGVFLLRKTGEPATRRMLCGMAAGIMLAASVWSLLLPAIERAEQGPLPAWVPPAVGLLLGAVGLLRLETLAGRLLNTGPGRCGRMVLAVTLHNLPEGMVVGLAAALALRGEPDAISGALALALGIGLQNIPEGAAVSLPLAQEGRSKRRAFAAGAASGLVEPLGGLLALALAGWVSAALPWLMSLAAGCMVCVTAQEMIPEAVEADEPAGVISVVAGFALMMALDVAL
jgi:ZIP family zinc transporter